MNRDRAIKRGAWGDSQTQAGMPVSPCNPTEPKSGTGILACDPAGRGGFGWFLCRPIWFLLALTTVLQALYAQSPSVEADQLLRDAQQAHGGASAATQARRIILSGTAQVRTQGGLADRSFTLHAGTRGTYRAEFTAPGFQRIFVNNGEFAYILQDGKRSAARHRDSANQIFPYNPLTGIFQALTRADLEPISTATEEGGAIVVEVLYLDRQPRVPRSRSLQRRYQIRLDPDTLLASSLTLFSNYGLDLVPDEPELVWEYSDYRTVDGMVVPFRVRERTPRSDLVAEYQLESLSASQSEPDLSLP